MIILALLLMCMLTLSVRLQIAKAQPSTITVPDDYPTIQEAINNANDGDTVFVKSGVYQQLNYDNTTPVSIVINKSISLIGQDEETTIISGVSAPPPPQPLPPGFNHIIIINADNVTIKGFTIQNGFFGCWVFGSGCLISDSKFINNDEGVSLEAGGNTVSDCFFNGSTSCGIVIFESSNNALTSNVVQKASFGGINVYSGSSNTIVGNEISDGADFGIILDMFSANNTVANNEITNCGWENVPNPMDLYSSGVVLNLASSNQIVDNNVSDSRCGLHQSSSNNNIIYHNSFIDNQVQVEGGLFASANLWDDGYPFGGNYWSDYGGPDLYRGPYQNVTGSDGIGDTSYVIEANNIDHYPLMKPYASPIGDVNMDGKVDIKDIGIVALSFGSSWGALRWNPLADVNHDGKVDIRDIGLVAKHFGERY
jgi:parallel beta-helix repeat protein